MVSLLPVPVTFAVPILGFETIFCVAPSGWDVGIKTMDLAQKKMGISPGMMRFSM